jgi:hypothetical protein
MTKIRYSNIEKIQITLFIFITLFNILLFAGVSAASNNMGSITPYYGTYNTEIPIKTIQFRKIAPSIKLVYNSDGKNSVMGVGWNITGPSAIIRASKEGGIPNYDDSDIFFLDGHELMPCTTQGGTHCTKIQNYTRIIRDEDNNKWLMLGSKGNTVTFEPVYNTSQGTLRQLSGFNQTRF